MRKGLAAAAAFGAAVLMSAGAQAQDSYGAAYPALSPFEGIYAGVYGGGRFVPGMSALTAGIIAGANFSITDSLVLGLEAQGGATFGPAISYDALMLARAGAEFNDQFLVYGAAGGGWISGVGSYAVGGGAEFLALDQLSVRGEVLGTGTWGAGLGGVKANAGVLWHLR